MVLWCLGRDKAYSWSWMEELCYPMFFFDINTWLKFATSFLTPRISWWSACNISHILPSTCLSRCNLAGLILLNPDSLINCIYSGPFWPRMNITSLLAKSFFLNPKLFGGQCSPFSSSSRFYKTTNYRPYSLRGFSPSVISLAEPPLQATNSLVPWRNGGYINRITPPKT